MENRKDVTVPMPAALVEQIDEQLDYGDSRSAWIREAVRMRLQQVADEGNSKTAVATAD